MNKTEKKFIWYAVAAVFVLITVLLAVVNVVSFTMASEDADRVTELLAHQNGAFQPGSPASGETQRPFRPMEEPGRMGPMGPNSPELNATLRYFTFAFPAQGGEGAGETVAFHLSAVTEAEAEAWAESLVKENTGWTRGTYRYRVYTEQGKTYVTVIDYGRELQSCYRILVISAVGDLICLALAILILHLVGRRLFAPLEEADRKQKQFLRSAQREFQLPLTVISADTELIERDRGPDDRTRSIHRQVKRMSGLVQTLRDLSVFEETPEARGEVSLSELLHAELDRRAEGLTARGLRLEADIAPDVRLTADGEAMARLVGELLDNAERYALTWASVGLKREGERVALIVRNDAALPDGPCDQVFDRFTQLENARSGEGVGLGLAYAKDIVKAHAGRVSAQVAEGVFTLRVAL